MVELPLGAPVILAGIRTAAVWTIGAATLATTVGQPSLGDLIFSGLQTENWVRVLVGCAAAAALALGRRRAARAGRIRAAAAARAGGCGSASARWSPRSAWPSLPLPGAAAGGETRGDRRQEFLRAIYPRERDRAAAAGGRLPHRAARQSRLDRRLSGARGRRYRRLCRLFAGRCGPTSSSAPTRRRPTAMRAALTGELRAPRRRAAARRARLRECLCAGDAARAGPRRSASRTLDDLDPRGAAARARRRPRIPDPARMALGAGAATASASPGSAPTARPSCTARSPTARPT